MCISSERTIVLSFECPCMAVCWLDSCRCFKTKVVRIDLFPVYC